MVEVAEAIENMVREGVSKWMDEQSKTRESGFHVSSLVYGCPRNIYYEYSTVKKEDANAEDEGDSDGIFKMWIGHELHKTPITEFHEVPLHKKYKVDKVDYDLWGHIDEIAVVDGKRYIIDKKFVGFFPYDKMAGEYVMREHHRQQVLFYAYLYQQNNNLKVDGVVLLYFIPTLHWKYLKGNPRMKVIVNELSQAEIEKAGEYMNSLITDTIEAIGEASVPDKKQSWFCKYCPFKENCKQYSLANGEDFDDKFLE